SCESICGNLIIYEPSFKKSFIFEHDRSLCAIINLLSIAAPLSWRSKHNSFPLWLIVFPEKRFSLSNQETSITKVAIHTNLFTDLYALIGIESFEIG
ncbi:hypothetical protein CY35_11G113300, partial [Sphagnum magellanicum]